MTRLEVMFFSMLLLVGSGCADRISEPEPIEVDYPAVITQGRGVIEVEVVSEPMRRARGLMFRSFLAEDRGMLFVFPVSAVETFWMKNTLIPLDMIWMDEGKSIIWIERDVPPCEVDPCPSYGPVDQETRFVLELSAGGADRYGLDTGQRLEFRNIDTSLAR